MINKIWSVFIIIGIIFSLLTGKSEIITSEILKSCETSFNMIVKIFPVMALWLGIMNIALKSGLLNKMASLVSPILRKIFDDGYTFYGIKEKNELELLNINHYDDYLKLFDNF